jgi:LysM repeat protein
MFRKLAVCWAAICALCLIAVVGCSGATPTHEGKPTATSKLAAVSVTASSSPSATSPPSTSTPTQEPAHTNTSNPTLTPTPFTYVVEEGRTLLGIAIQFDTTTEALAELNNLTEEGSIQIGQELMIPSAKVPAAAATMESEGDLQPTASPGMEEIVLSKAPTATATSLPSSTPTASSPTPTLIPRPANVNPLTGLKVSDPAALNRRPLMVRVGNDPLARPQMGLNQADIVYEEIAEWWVTRFTAIYLAETPKTISPIRSSRLINVQLVPQYQGALLHAGGSDAVRWELSQIPIVDLDEYFHPQPYWYRPDEGWATRLAVDAVAAREYMAVQGTDASVALQGFLFDEDPPQGEAAQVVTIPYPQRTSLTEWRYDAEGGDYLRWCDHQPLKEGGGDQIRADNVIVNFAQHQETDIVEDANGATSIRIIVNGRGDAWFFRDGKLNKGYWETDGTRTPFFTLENGEPYYLKPGNTWMEVVPADFDIEFS